MNGTVCWMISGSRNAVNSSVPVTEAPGNEPKRPEDSVKSIRKTRDITPTKNQKAVIM
ncbi:hypothetical protein D3C87_1987600 [compost metagenome]